MPEPEQNQDKPRPIEDLDAALKGILGTPKAEVDAESKKEQRRKAKVRKPKKP